jgi:hypothetical protein
LKNSLQLDNCGFLSGIQEYGGFLTANGQEHVLSFIRLRSTPTTHPL